MKKIPTLFERTFDGHKIVDIKPVVTPGLNYILSGAGTATVKWDGSCVMIKNGRLYKRYDAKKGKTPPSGAIPCCDPDPVTGHWPHWVKVDANNNSDKWYCVAADNFRYNGRYCSGIPESGSDRCLIDGTYEAVGPKFQGNPYDFAMNTLIRHGEYEIPELNNGPRTFESIRDYLKTHCIEGIVFWDMGAPVCKIKRSDFGFAWPAKGDENG
ncbi:MAG: hypothetical protein MJ000_11135 [Bacteroidales bacterium]|nr:hypothetical protein [Bacteroidales bacterium]